MKKLLPVVAAALAAAALPAQAQWEGFGDPGWGWKKPVCWYCLTSVEVGAAKTWAKGDDTRYVDLATARTGEAKQTGEGWTASWRVGIGPHLFVDAGYTAHDFEGEREDVSIKRSVESLRYGIGYFVLSDPDVGGLYLRAGQLRTTQDGTVALRPIYQADAGSPTPGIPTSSHEPEPGHEGASRRYEAESSGGFGGSIGGVLNRGSVRLEANVGSYGGLLESALALSWAPVKHVAIVLQGAYLAIDNGRALVAVGGGAEETRQYAYQPKGKENVMVYGAGLKLQF